MSAAVLRTYDTIVNRYSIFDGSVNDRRPILPTNCCAIGVSPTMNVGSPGTHFFQKIS